MKIYKYTLSVTDLQVLSLPEGARLLTVQTQHGRPQLWALVNEKASMTKHRKFATYGTGNPMPDGDPGNYIGTYQLNDATLVFHVFEVN